MDDKLIAKLVIILAFFVGVLLIASIFFIFGRKRGQKMFIKKKKKNKVKEEIEDEEEEYATALLEESEDVFRTDLFYEACEESEGENAVEDRTSLLDEPMLEPEKDGYGYSTGMLYENIEDMYEENFIEKEKEQKVDFFEDESIPKDAQSPQVKKTPVNKKHSSTPMERLIQGQSENSGISGIDDNKDIYANEIFTNLTYTSILNAKTFCKCEFNDCHFTESTIKSCRFIDCKLRDTSFLGASFCETFVLGSSFDKINFRFAQVEKSWIFDSKFESSNFEKAVVKDTEIKESSFLDCKKDEYTDFSKAEIKNVQGINHARKSS